MANQPDYSPEAHARLLIEVGDLKAKLAQVEADAAAMREALREFADDGADQDTSAYHAWQILTEHGSGQRLLDELAQVKRERDDARFAHAAAQARDNYVREQDESLRATAQRRLELLRKCEFSAAWSTGVQTGACPICLRFQRHKPDCEWAAELKEGK